MRRRANCRHIATIGGRDVTGDSTHEHGDAEVPQAGAVQVAQKRCGSPGTGHAYDLALERV